MSQPLNMERPRTPVNSIDAIIEARASGQHYQTPHRATVRAICWWESQKPPLDRVPKTEIFQRLNVSHKRGYEMLKDDNEAEEPSSRTFNHRERKETRGRKPKISEEQAQLMEDIVENYGWDGRTLTWEQLAEEAGIDNVHTKAIRSIMNHRGYHICTACRKPWVDEDLAPRRKKWAEDMKAKYPKPEDWRRVRWSDECHGSFGPTGKIHVIRKPGQRGHPDCIQEIEEKGENDGYKVHWWAAIGYDFKSDITFYDVPTNSNGKMTHRVYIDQILEPIVKPWLEDGQDFVLEEDGDSGHGYNKNGTDNIVKKWKKEHSLITYKNCASSPDFAPIEQGWQPVKYKIRSQPHWDVETLKELVLEGWSSLKQESINKWVDSMPQRLQDCIDAEGHRIGY